jgi:hypothetical protein
MAISNNNTGIRTGVCTSSTRPTAPYEGQHIYETDTDIEYVWNGSAWVVNYVSAASPAFTGTPTAPTATAGTNTTQLATTAFANAAGGLVYIASATASAVSTVSLSNILTADYDNYLVVVSVTGTANTQIRMKLRNNTTDKSGNYYWGAYYFDMVGGGSLNGEGSGGSVTTGIRIAANNTAGISSAFVQLGNPFVTGRTTFSAQTQTSESYMRMFAGFQDEAYSANGITINIDSGTMTGKVRVYGYRQV